MGEQRGASLRLEMLPGAAARTRGSVRDENTAKLSVPPIEETGSVDLPQHFSNKDSIFSPQLLDFSLSRLD
jgi:hypothetical protein